MRAAAAYNKPSNRLEPSPIYSPDSFILTVPHPLPLTLTAAKDTQARGAQANGAWVNAQAPNRNQPAAAGRPGTHHPPKMAPNRPSFLIHNPELDTELSYTKQKFVLISNRQFFAVLKLPDALLRVSPCHAERLRRARPASRKSLRTTENRERLIGNDVHSPASATALQCATSIFLIGNEFRFAACAFRPSFFHSLAPLFGRFQPHFSTSRSPRLPFRGPLFSIFFGFGQGTASAVPKEMPRVILPIACFTRLPRRRKGANKNLFRRSGLKPRQKSVADSSSYRAPHPRERFRSAWIWTRFLRSTFAFRVSIFDLRISFFDLSVGK